MSLPMTNTTAGARRSGKPAATAWTAPADTAWPTTAPAQPHPPRRRSNPWGVLASARLPVGAGGAVGRAAEAPVATGAAGPAGGTGVPQETMPGCANTPR